MKSLRVLGIETSCDETAISLIEISEDGRKMKLLSNVVHSQIDVHAPYGGVFPTLAKREHQRNLVPVLKKALKEASMLSLDKGITLSSEIKKIFEKEPELALAFDVVVAKIKKPEIDLISVTVGPGLEPALWVGINFARALSTLWNIPLVPSNHMEGHILAALIKKEKENNYALIEKDIKYPALSLLVSGGHTEILLIEKAGSYKVAGETLDDAIGECFDKIARTLGLPYPGGPKISKLAEEARKEDIHSPEILPRPMIDSKNLNFSFSGLKTAVLYLVKRIGKLDEKTIKGICREAEDAIVEVVISKIRKAIETYSAETLIIGGGVIANTRLRKSLEDLALECSIVALLPETSHATDNGLMIALSGYVNRDKALPPNSFIKAQGNLSFI